MDNSKHAIYTTSLRTMHFYDASASVHYEEYRAFGFRSKIQKYRQGWSSINDVTQFWTKFLIPTPYNYDKPHQSNNQAYLGFVNQCMLSENALQLSKRSTNLMIWPLCFKVFPLASTTVFNPTIQMQNLSFSSEMPTEA